VLEESHHLSYPFVFEADDGIYMIPESAATRSVDLYKAYDFPRGWRHEATLLQGVSAADATLFRHDGLWWMFAAVGEDGSSRNDQLHIYWAQDVRGPWQPHVGNPVKIDVSSVRPAGRLFRRGVALLRPTQDCSRVYGGGVTLCEVTELSRESFAEVEVERLLPDWLPANVAFHTLSSSGRLEMIDGRILSTGASRFPAAHPSDVRRALARPAASVPSPASGPHTTR
jgi:hypothetical protein